MHRHEFPATVKAQAYERCKSKDGRARCEDCGRKLLHSGDYHYDHDIPDYLGGSNNLANCKVRCKSCHIGKTSQIDQPAIAKSRRLRRRHVGIKRKKNLFPHWRRFEGRREWAKRTGEEPRRYEPVRVAKRKQEGG